MTKTKKLQVVPDRRKLKELEKRINHRFRNRDLLKLALTHSSAVANGKGEANNERLEFVGDRVLGLAIVEMLYELYPNASEGELARRFNALVRRETCAQVAEDWQLGRFLRLGEGEAESGGRRKANILADACEAVLGAVFLDGGFGRARKLVTRDWRQLATQVEDVRADPKSALQEWAQGDGKKLPVYKEISREGPDHEPMFTSQVSVGGIAPAIGKGASKRLAEQAAAQEMLEREGVWEPASK